MIAKSKLARDRDIGLANREVLVDRFLNPAFIASGKPLRLMPPGVKHKGMEYLLLNIHKLSLRKRYFHSVQMVVHFRQSKGNLFFKMPSRHNDPTSFLDSINDHVIVFFEVLDSGQITGRFGAASMTIRELRERFPWERGGKGNENLIYFIGFKYSDLEYRFLDDETHLLGSSLIMDLCVRYENLSRNMANGKGPRKSTHKKRISNKTS